MKYFLDSAILDEISYADKHWGIDGVTTNPRHIKNSGKPFLKLVRDLASAYRGRDFPISVEIDPYLEGAREMVAAAREISRLADNFVIKLPCTEQGLVAARELEQEGIRTNITLVFSPSQALQAARIGAAYVSPFVGWKEASGEEGMAYIGDIADIYKARGCSTQIIVAAVRSGSQIARAALLGADIVTAGFSVYKDSFEHPFTSHGLRVFQQAWDEMKVEEQ